MKNAVNVMYVIGKIFNIFSIIFCPIMFIIGALLGFSQDSPNADNLELATIGSCMLFISIPLLIFSIVSLVVCRNRKRLIDQGTKSTSPGIVLIVFGILADNIFYSLAGIFALVLRSQQLNSEQE